MFELLTKICIFTSLLGLTLTNECGDWVAYKDEKCLKVFDHLVEDSMAEGICRQNTNESVLALIKTSDEQQFIEEYLKKMKVSDNVWIGIKKINGSFKYSDQTDIEYNNWAKGRPVKGSSDLNCVEISVDETNYGKWMDDRCKKKNAVLCERIQPWSVARLQSILLETRRIQNERQDQLSEKIVQLTKLINNVPIGFIYAQLSGQTDPKTLWPNTEWENISAKYSGLFFRAEGGQSLTFGEIQDQQSHSLEIYNHSNIGNNFTSGESKTITDKTLENFIFTGTYHSTNFCGINMRHNNQEIRPRNQAMRIWQRIK